MKTEDFGVSTSNNKTIYLKKDPSGSFKFEITNPSV